MSLVLLERREHVAIVKLNRPDALNAFNHDLVTELKSMLENVAIDPAIRAVVLTGTGRGFNAGADLGCEEMSSGAAIEREINAGYAPSLLAIAEMPKPVIAAAHGFVTGIGASFVLTCDLVVMGEKTFLQVPFGKLGLIPDGGMTYLLPAAIGYRRAFEMAMNGDRVPATRCLEWGLCNRVVPEDQVLDVAISWASVLCGAAPLALTYTKQMLRHSQSLGYRSTILEEAHLQAGCIDSEDFREGVTAFREKRLPTFQGK